MQLLGMFGFPGYVEIAVIVMAGLLIFGRRLPEVGRSVGRTIVEFKKGIREVKDEVNTAATSNPPAATQIEPPPATTTDPSADDKSAGGDKTPSAQS